MTLQASDPDVGDSGWLTYSIVGSSRHFDVESSSGLVYVVSVADLAGTKAILEVKVSDPTGLQAVTKVEVSVEKRQQWSGIKRKGQGPGFHTLDT